MEFSFAETWPDWAHFLSHSKFTVGEHSWIQNYIWISDQSSLLSALAEQPSVLFPRKKILSTVTRSAFKPCVTCAHGGKSVIRRDEAQWLIHLYIPLFYIQKYFSDTLSLAHRLDRILLEDFQVHTGHSKRILVGLI